MLDQTRDKIDGKRVRRIVCRSDSMVWFEDDAGKQWRHFPALDKSFPLIDITSPWPRSYWKDQINWDREQALLHRPWPPILPGYGRRIFAGEFQRCRLCAAGTWIKYGETLICLRCAKEAAMISPAPPFYVAWVDKSAGRLSSVIAAEKVVYFSRFESLPPFLDSSAGRQ